MNAPATPVNQPILNNVRVPLAPIRAEQVVRPTNVVMLSGGTENMPPGTMTNFLNNQFDQLTWREEITTTLFYDDRTVYE